MRKLFAILFLIGTPCFGASLKKSTAIEVVVWFFDPATNLGKTGLTVTSETCRYIKADMTTASFSPTASGGSNDQVEIGNGAYRQELTAAQLDTVGPFELSCQISGSTALATVYDVEADASYATHINGDIASIADFWAQLTSSFSTPGSVGNLLKDNLDAPVTTVLTVLGTPIGADLATDIANIADPWNVALPGAYGAGTAGKIVGDKIVSSVTGSVGSVTGAVGSVTGAVGSVTGNVGGNVTGSVGSVATGGITTGSFAAGAINAAAIATDAIGSAEVASSAVDKIVDQTWDEVISGHLTSGTTGSSLNAAGSAGDPWATLLPGVYGAGTAGNIIGNNVNATISSRLAPTVAGRTLDVSTGGEAGIDWANVGSPTTVVGLSGTTIKNTTDVLADTAAIKAKTNSLTFTVANQADVNVVDWKGATAPAMTGDAFARLGAPAGASVSADVAAIKADTASIKTKSDQLTFTVANQVNATTVTNNDKTGYTLTVTPPTAAAISTQVWSEALPGSFGAGTAGFKLNAASAAADPWGVALPGAYGVGTAGKILGNVGTVVRDTLTVELPASTALPNNPTIGEVLRSLFDMGFFKLTTVTNSPSQATKTIFDSAGNALFKQIVHDDGTQYTQDKNTSAP